MGNLPTPDQSKRIFIVATLITVAVVIAAFFLVFLIMNYADSIDTSGR